MTTEHKREKRGFTLVEMMAVLIIAVLIMLAVVGIYGRLRDAAANVHSKLDGGMTPRLVAQRIAEDLDRLAAPGLDTKVTLENKFQGGFNLTRLIIENRIINKAQQPEVFEKVTWQTSYDAYENRLVLYRAHSGVNLEDKLIDQELAEKQQGEREMFIPVAEGLSFFSIQVPQVEAGEKPKENLDEDALEDLNYSLNLEEVTYEPKWDGKDLPKAVTVMLSFADFVTDMFGNSVVPEESIYYRTIAIDRTRMIPFKFVKKTYDLPEVDVDDESNPYEEDETSEPNTVELDIMTNE